MATLNSLLLLSPVVVAVIGAVAGLAFGAAVVAIICVVLNKAKANSVNEKIQKMYSDAESECKKMRKEVALEAKEQDLKLRNDFERDTKEKRIELQKMEQRLNQKDELLNKKDNNLLKKNEELEQQKRELDKKIASINQKQEKIDKEFESVVAKLEEISGLTKEEAKQQLSDSILDETRRDVAVQVRNMEQEAKDEADKKAKDIISLAIQRCATDHASEITVSVVPLPSDDMKARIIGREGRNIRALENATGIEIVVDDTPEVVIVSGFDPVRREVARIALEKLIADGRIHPARIEETVEKVRKDLDVQI